MIKTHLRQQNQDGPTDYTVCGRQLDEDLGNQVFQNGSHEILVSDSVALVNCQKCLALAGAR